MKGDLAPTARLRFVERAMQRPLGKTPAATVRVLQQYWAPDVAEYMRSPGDGVWWDVPVESE